MLFYLDDNIMLFEYYNYLNNLKNYKLKFLIMTTGRKMCLTDFTDFQS